MMNNKFLGLVLGAMLLTLMALILVVTKDTRIAAGSVNVANEYFATTTGSGSSYNGVENLIKTGSGTLGSIVFTAPTTAIIEVWNATSSNAALRTGTTASSTILLAHFPAGTGTSTVVLDVTYGTGLLITSKSALSSTTITIR